MPGLPYLFDAALSFNNKQNSPRGQRFTSKPAGFGCRHSTENLKHYKKRLCTGFLAFATIVTALPSTVVHAERKQYWTQSNERVGIVEKVMNDGSIGSTFNEGMMKVEGETAYCIDINTDFKNGYKTRADASSRMSADQISDVALSLEIGRFGSFNPTRPLFTARATAFTASS